MTQDVFEGLYRAYFGQVYHYLLSRCGDHHLAEELTADTFFRALRNLDRFRGESDPGTWLCAIAKNLWLNRCKKQKRELHPETLAETLPCSDPPMEDLLEEKDLSFQIHRVLHHLKEPYKEVFTLRVFGQLSFGDIASLFGKSESWARVTYHRGRKQLIETLRKEGSL